MFTNLANYLLGNQQPQEQESSLDEDNVRLRAVDADDDWVLVDNSVDGDDERRDCDLDESCFESIPSSELAIADRFLRASPTEFYSLSRCSSLSSLPACLSLEESWFLTPPPCFTSAGPAYLETSPLEDLLIEHPSMSVYQRSPSGGAPRSGAVRPPLPPAPAEARPAPRPNRRTAAAAAAHQQDKQGAQLKSAQKIHQCRVNQVLKRNPLERTNKAREINAARNKRQRRSDHQQHHSGANNNRKCC